MTADLAIVDRQSGERHSRAPRFRLLREYLRRPLGVVAGVFLLIVVVAAVHRRAADRAL